MSERQSSAGFFSDHGSEQLADIQASLEAEQFGTRAVTQDMAAKVNELQSLRR